MSKYVELRTSVTDERYLVEALQELGYETEVCREGRALVGYLGDKRAERAQIIIPRGQLDAASNEIGFSPDGDGVYQAIVSEYDRGIGFDDVWALVNKVVSNTSVLRLKANLKHRVELVKRLFHTAGDRRPAAVFQ